MSAVAITIQALMANAGVGSFAGSRITAVAAEPYAGGDRSGDIIVHLISEDDTMLLSGAARFCESRVSIECRSISSATAIRMGEAVKDALTPIAGATFAGRRAWFFKEGTDATDRKDDVGLSRRILDYYVRWR